MEMGEGGVFVGMGAATQPTHDPRNKPTAGRAWAGIKWIGG